MIKSKISSWGKTKIVNCKVDTLENYATATSALPIGLLKSYGDSCLPLDNQIAIKLNSMNRIINFDVKNGIIEAEAGITLNEMINVIVPKGWFLPVTPGTKNITLGGAIANDVHGKNQQAFGNFGNHLQSIELITSNGTRYHCSETSNQELFRATIAGLGLTGIIKSAIIKLRPIQNTMIAADAIKFESLEEWYKLNEDSKQFEYSVAWLDLLCPNIRGIYYRGNHCLRNNQLNLRRNNFTLTIPFPIPCFFINRFLVKLFNTFYFWKNLKKITTSKIYFDQFFYPLDAIKNWNNLYGKLGLCQFQCVIPHDQFDKLKLIIDTISSSREIPTLAVLKSFGEIPAKGILSFPQPGISIAIDFQNTGKNLDELFLQLNKIVLNANGRIYPAKDSKMNEDEFKTFYPNYQKFLKYRDPMLHSLFSKRVNL